MDARSIIAQIRDGETPSGDALRWIANGLADGRVTDAQAGAFAMAALLNGLDEAGRVALTLAMRDSGVVQKWDLPGPVLDKHSTGGIGDNVSLMLAPALAVCGAFVPMISGRGLGHTGGTLDKLDAIPGYQSEVPSEKMREVVAKVGCAIVGASGDIAPADKRLYGVRDITGTVESVDLITASILSKKLAAGLGGLVLDVKVGNGAFLPEIARAETLAQSLVDVGGGAGCRTAALITDMNEPLASCAGNALEVANAVAFLRGDHIDGRLFDVTVALGGLLLELGGLCDNTAEGQTMIATAFQDGSAAEKFARMVAALGGPSDFVDRCANHLRRAPVTGEIGAPRSGFVTAVDARALGEVVVALGGGRFRHDDRLDLTVGLDQIIGPGAFVEAGDPLAIVHAADQDRLDAATRSVLAAIGIGPEPPEETALIVERIG